MKTFALRFAALLMVLVLGSAVAARAQDLGAVKERMQHRISAVDALKTKGVIGENNAGLLELRGGDADAGDVVAAENRDRAIAYAEIAKQTGSSVEQVSHARARQIAATSAKGVWLQRPSGEWYKK